MAENNIKLIDKKINNILKKNENEESFLKNVKKTETEIIWGRVLFFGSIHIGALYGVYLMIVSAKYQTVIAWFILSLFSGIYKFFLRLI